MPRYPDRRRRRRLTRPRSRDKTPTQHRTQWLHHRAQRLYRRSFAGAPSLAVTQTWKNAARGVDGEDITFGAKEEAKNVRTDQAIDSQPFQLYV
jgi:hypothetical protein